MRRLLTLVVLLAAPSATAAPIPAGGTVLAVAQDRGSTAWIERGSLGCELRVRASSGATGSFKLPACVLPGADLVSGGGRWAWGGYEEVRCSETTAAVYVSVGPGAKLVKEIPGDCLGFGTSFQGLASDGRSFWYSLLETRPKSASSRCGDGGPCRWRLAGGTLVRAGGGAVSGLPPAALIAGGPGRLALVQAAASAASNGKTFDWPRAAANGRVDVRSTATGRVVTSFRPLGVVRAIALSAIRAVVIVESGSTTRLEWYDSDTGERLGSVGVARARQVASDGRLAAFVAGGAVHVLDLETGAQRIVGHGATTGVSVSGHRVVWGAGSRIVEARA
jgi:hypothetical protein